MSDKNKSAYSGNLGTVVVIIAVVGIVYLLSLVWAALTFPFFESSKRILKDLRTLPADLCNASAPEP